MLVNNIPSSQIISKIAKVDKDYDLEFVNSDTNSDIYTLRIYLRRFDQDQKIFYKIRLQLTCVTLAYPSFGMSWSFKEDEYELAYRVFHRICDEVDDIKAEFDKSMAPSSILAPQIREAVKPISVNHQEKSNNLPIDESNKESGVSDWRRSLYSDRYPGMSNQEKQNIQQTVDITHFKEQEPSRRKSKRNK